MKNNKVKQHQQVNQCQDTILFNKLHNKNNSKV